MCLLLVSAVSNRNQEHPFCRGNLTEFIHQCWDLSVSRSNEQIKFKLSAGRRRSIPFGVGADSQPGNATCVRPLEPRGAAEALQPGLPGTTHALHTLPCFSSQLCGRALSAKDADLLSSSQETGLCMTVPQQRVLMREDSSLMPFGVDYNSF